MQKFLLGTATAAHQVEGNNIHSDYWAMEHMKYQNFSEPSLAAVDHYNRYEEDIKMMAEANLNAYRFSIEWARIEPEEGVFDQNEIEHYRDVLKICHKYNIEPVVTLHHFTSPKWLISLGGWKSERVVFYFTRYVKKVISELGSLFDYVCTINEANMGIQVSAIMERYKKQMLAGRKSDAEGQAQVGMNFNQMLANRKLQEEECVRVFGVPKLATFVSPRSKESDQLVMKAHVEARRIIKELYPHIKVGLTLSLHDIQAQAGGKERAKKEWDDEFLHYLPYIKDDDFFGLQNYTRLLIGPEGQLPYPEGAVLTQMGYEYYPEGLENVIRKVYQDLKIPIMVTENGIATADDDLRCAFIKEALNGVQRSIADGIPVIGYLHWSFCDNFEWQKGYSMQFGLVAVERKTMKRAKKKSLDLLGSYRWFEEMFSRNRRT